MIKPVPPAAFQENMNIPEAEYRTAIAIKHPGRMTQVTVIFTLRDHDSKLANYAAPCPRCQCGEISVAVELNQDGSFAGPPACPALCLSCEDRLDAVLEPGAAKVLAGKSLDRAALNEHLKAMTVRDWD